MTYSLIVLALAQPVGLFLLFRYLNQRDRLEQRDRQVWANRVQSPETAVVQTLPDPVDLGRPDTEWTEAHDHELERLTEDA